MKPAVLIVDDSLTVRMDLDEGLRAAGLETTLCDSVAAARGALARGPSLIVLDVLLPDGDGVEFLKEIKSAPTTRRIPVILLSTEAEVRDRVRGLQTGADDYIGKPYDRSHVVSRALELVRSSLPEESSPSVLLIDDSATFRETVKSALQSRGYSVATAETGEEGLRIAFDLRPRAVVVDGVLPGIDGAAVVRRLRQDATLRRTPCLLLTASEEAGGELRAFESGADGYVRKDQDLELVLTRLEAILRRSGAEAPAETGISVLGPKRILAVDDSATFLQELAGQLRMDGYDPVLARSGDEALQLLAVQNVDCILLDLVMPGVSGNDLCRRIKGAPEWRDIPLVILTSREEREAMIEGINAGADDYIVKTADFDVLKARVRAQLRRKQFEDETRRMREQLLQKEVEAAEARAARELAEMRSRLLADLERKNRELESFSYSVSHDLRAPLRAISGFAQILVEEHSASLGQEPKRLLSVIVDNVRRMDQLINDLLEFSRVARAELRVQEVDMARLARAVFEELSAGKRVELKLGPIAPVRGDASMLRQVWANLLGNAIKYSRPRDPAVVEIGSREEAGRRVYFVRDNGVGFDMKYANKLFGVFQRLHSPREFEGTGCGLALVQRIVERHGGRAWGEGKVGAGATFFFEVPADEPR
jgi:DNA-binding response OmpR family regulator